MIGMSNWFERLIKNFSNNFSPRSPWRWISRYKLFLYTSIVLIAIFDEGIQFLIPSRIPDVNDLYYDLLGGFLGMFTLFIKEKIYG